jgi:hypothetical protein
MVSMGYKDKVLFGMRVAVFIIIGLLGFFAAKIILFPAPISIPRWVSIQDLCVFFVCVDFIFDVGFGVFYFSFHRWVSGIKSCDKFTSIVKLKLILYPHFGATTFPSHVASRPHRYILSSAPHLGATTSPPHVASRPHKDILNKVFHFPATTSGFHAASRPHGEILNSIAHCSNIFFLL